MKILFLASEATPFVKVGGLADVAGELPRALRTLGLDVRLCLPYYPSIRRADYETHLALNLRVPRGDVEVPVEMHSLDRQGLPVYLFDAEPVRAWDSVYADLAADGEKFTLTSLAALRACELLEWKPDIVHANDWHTAASIVWLAGQREARPFWRDAVSLFSIHNLAYMGAGTEEILAAYDITELTTPHLPVWAKHTPLPMALWRADWLSTVSPTYAQEIQTPEFGCGLETILETRRERLVGILNGIDTQSWDPGRDASLPVKFTSQRLEPRAEVKRRLQSRLGLAESETIPLLGVVSRLDHQKGIDLALEALELLPDVEWQFVLLGTGSEDLESRARSCASVFDDRVRAVLRFDLELARWIYGGSDMLLIPSRYEPCGLTQMIAMRYGSVPVVRETGGLKDTVKPFGLHEGTGFRFKEIDAQALATVIRQALAVFDDRAAWRELQRRGMVQDHGWSNAAKEYVRLYERAAEAGRA